jgi:nicotinamidase-related amidase
MTELLRYGRLTDHTIHLCIDMQAMFAEATPWHTPWMPRVIPVIRAIAEKHAQNTVFTRFITPPRPEDMPGAWRRYYEKWRDFTTDRLDARLLELVAPLKDLAPPAIVIDKKFYSAFSSPLLRPALEIRAIDSLVITGAETDVCVLATVMDAMDLGYRVILPTDALCSGSDTTHDALMRLYRSRYGQQIETCTAEAVLDSWES